MSLLAKNPQLTMRSWFTAIIILFLFASLVGSERGISAREEAEDTHKRRLDPELSENGKTKANWDVKLLEVSTPVLVKTGIYVERIIDLSLPDASWVADFYIWFRWDNADINPGETFQIVDGEILKKELIKKNKTTTPSYGLYRVKARVTKFFDISRYPRDDHLLTINVEDTEHQIYELQYIPDEDSTEVSSRVKLQGYEVYNKKLVQKFHSYKTDRGEVHKSDVSQDTYSQLIYGIWIKRPGWGSYIKMFEGLFAAVAVAMLSFFIRTTTTNRISLGVGAFFAAVAATYVATKNIPNIGVLTLTDVITGVSMLMIFLVIWHTIIATRLFEVHQDEKMVHRFDMIGFIIFLTSFVIVNATMVINASI